MYENERFCSLQEELLLLNGVSLGPNNNGYPSFHAVMNIRRNSGTVVSTIYLLIDTWDYYNHFYYIKFRFRIVRYMYRCRSDISLSLEIRSSVLRNTRYIRTKKNPKKKNSKNSKKKKKIVLFMNYICSPTHYIAII